MKTKAHIKLLTILTAILNPINQLYLQSLMAPYVNSTLHLLIMLLVSIVLVFILLYYFYKGCNWARILVITSAAFGLLNFFGAISTPILPWKTICFLNGALAVYLLVFLNTKAAREFFKPKIDIATQKQPKILLVLKIIIRLVIVTLIGIYLLCICLLFH